MRFGYPIPDLRRLSRLGAVLAAFLTSGCVTMTGGGETDVVCEAWRPVTWSAADTDQTIREVRQNNAAWKAWCDA